MNNRGGMDRRVRKKARNGRRGESRNCGWYVSKFLKSDEFKKGKWNSEIDFLGPIE